jgi:dTDP-glucose 4,6-dehydratase
MQNVLGVAGASFIDSNFENYLTRIESDIKVINLDAPTYAGNFENLINVLGTDNIPLYKIIFAISWMS